MYRDRIKGWMKHADFLLLDLLCLQLSFLIVYSIRQDITFKLFTEGVVQNTDGSIAYNLMQNDMVALRAVMRLGWEIPNPINSVEKNKEKRCPFAVMKAGA